jgi:hypothetical protein
LHRYDGGRRLHDGTEPFIALAQGADNASIASSGAGSLGPTATAARKQNWDCKRIEPAIAKLLTGMRATKERAEKEQEQPANTIERMFARASGPPGTGNAALDEFQEARSDIDQLNDLLREKGCATYPIGVDVPAFLKQ